MFSKSRPHDLNQPVQPPVSYPNQVSSQHLHSDVKSANTLLPAQWRTYPILNPYSKKNEKRASKIQAPTCISSKDQVLIDQPPQPNSPHQKSPPHLSLQLEKKNSNRLRRTNTANSVSPPPHINRPRPPQRTKKPPPQNKHPQQPPPQLEKKNSHPLPPPHTPHPPPPPPHINSHRLPKRTTNTQP